MLSSFNTQRLFRANDVFRPMFPMHNRPAQSTRSSNHSSARSSAAREVHAERGRKEPSVASVPKFFRKFLHKWFSVRLIFSHCARKKKKAEFYYKSNQINLCMFRFDSLINFASSVAMDVFEVLKFLNQWSVLFWNNADKKYSRSE